LAEFPDGLGTLEFHCRCQEPVFDREGFQEQADTLHSLKSGKLVLLSCPVEVPQHGLDYFGIAGRGADRVEVGRFLLKFYIFFCKHPVVSLRILRIEIYVEAVFYYRHPYVNTPIKSTEHNNTVFFYISYPYIYLSLPLFITFSLYAPLCLDDLLTIHTNTIKSIGLLFFKDARYLKWQQDHLSSRMS